MGTTPAMRKVRSTSFKLRKLPKTKYRMEIESPTFAFISAASQALMRTSPLFKSGYRLVAETKEYGVSELCEPFELRKPLKDKPFTKYVRKTSAVESLSQIAPVISDSMKTRCEVSLSFPSCRAAFKFKSSGNMAFSQANCKASVA